MNGSTQPMLRQLGLSLAAALGLTMTSAALAAIEADASAAEQAPVAQMQELGEIWVRGQSLSRMIEDAEDQFIRHYNKLNKNRDYDVVCDYLRLSRDSLAMTRTCVPHFLGYMSVGAGVGAVMSGGMTLVNVPICSPGNYITTDTGTYFSSGSCTPAFGPFNGYSGSGFSSSRTSGMLSYSSYSAPVAASAVLRGPPPNPVTAEQRQEYARNLMRTIYSDQKLLEEATTLASLYREMQTIQDEYQMAKAEDDARKEAARRERREQRERDSGPPRDNNPRL